MVVQSRRLARAVSVEEKFLREIFSKLNAKLRRELGSLLNFEIDRWSKRLTLLQCYLLGENLNDYGVQAIVNKAFGTNGEIGLVERFNLKYILAGRISSEKEQLFWEQNVLPGQKNARNLLNKWVKAKVLLVKIGRNFELTPEGTLISQYLLLRLLSELHVTLPIEEGIVTNSGLVAESGEDDESPTPEITWVDLEQMYLVERTDLGEMVRFTPTSLADDLVRFSLLHPNAEKTAFRAIRIRCLKNLEQSVLDLLKQRITAFPLIEGTPSLNAGGNLQAIDEIAWIYKLGINGDLQQEQVHQFLFSNPTETRHREEDESRTNLIIIESGPGTGKSTWVIQIAIDILLGIKEKELRTLPIIFQMKRFALVEKENDLFLIYGESTLGEFKSKKDRDSDYFEEILGALIATILPFTVQMDWANISSKLFRGCSILLFFDGWTQVSPNLRPFFCQFFNFLTREEFRQLKIVITTRWVDPKLASFVQESWGSWAYEEDDFSNTFELDTPDPDQILHFFKTLGVELATDRDPVDDLEQMVGRLLTPLDLWFILLCHKIEQWPASRAELYYRWIKYETLVEYYERFNQPFPSIQDESDLTKYFRQAQPFYRVLDDTYYSLKELFEGPVPGATPGDEHIDFAVLSFLAALAYRQKRNPDFFFSYQRVAKNNPLLSRFLQAEFTEDLYVNCRISSVHYEDYLIALHCANQYQQGLRFILPEEESIELLFNEITKTYEEADVDLEDLRS